MWAQICSFMIGLWLMFSPYVLSYGDPAQMNDRIVGPVAGSFAFIAIWEVTRPLRWLNVLFGFWLILAPWILGYDTSEATINSMASGTVMLGLSLVKGITVRKYGGGWSALWKSQSTPPDQK